MNNCGGDKMDRAKFLQNVLASEPKAIRIFVIDEELLIGESIAAFLSSDPRLTATAYKRLALANLDEGYDSSIRNKGAEVILLRTVASRGRFGCRRRGH